MMKHKSEVEAILAKTSELEIQIKNLEAAKEKAATAQIASNSYSTGMRSNSDEQKCLTYFGAKDVRDLLRANTADFNHAPEELKQMVRTLKKDVDSARFIAQMFYGDEKDMIGQSEDQDRLGRCKNILASRFGRDVLAPKLKAFGSTISGGGQDWVPTLVSQNYIPEYQLDRVVEGRLNQMKMPSNPYKLSVQSGVTKARQIAENTAISGVNFNTTSITFNAKKIGEFYILPEELTEDSAPDIYGLARDELTQAQMRAVESAIINGDTTATHMDTDTAAAGADVAEKLWKGFRKIAIANSANGGTKDFTGAAVTTSNLRSMRSQMKRFGVDPLNLLWIVGPAVYEEFLTISEVATLEKFGPQATVLKGALTAYQGIPILVSQYMREDLNALGVNDGITSAFGGLLLVNSKRFYVGMRRPIVLKVMPDLANQDRWLMASYQRKDFEAHVQGASETSVVYGYNIAV